MRKLRVGLGVALFAVAAVAAGPALAEPDAKILQDRENLMKNQAQDLGAIKGYLDGKAELPAAEKAAADLPETMKKIPALFPEGSGGKSPSGKYATKPEIWSDSSGFLAARQNGEQKADALLAAVKTGDKAKIQEAFADMGKNGCGGCHGKFREEVKQ